MTAVFTYKEPKHKIYNFPVDQKSWITKSIKAAKKVGYRTCLYTDSDTFAQGLPLDELNFISDDYNIWDSFKIYVLEYRKDLDYFLCDNDCVFHKYLPFDNNVDIFFDGIETDIFHTTYFKTVKKLHLNNIVNLSYLEKTGVVNVGILKINNQELKDRYIDEWKALYNKLQDEVNDYPILGLTATITQGTLSNILFNSQYKYEYFTDNTTFKNWSKGNTYYKHYVGINKKTKPSEII